MIDQLIGYLRARLPEGRPGVIGLTGSVAVGKTTLAHAIADSLGAEVVGTDGFLLPNSVLESRGILDRKGFPETFDARGLLEFVASLRAGADPLEVPTYDHGTYDVGLPRSMSPVPRIVVLEGINALAQPALLDVAVYLDAEEATVIDWYVARFLGLRAAARSDPSSFYGRFLAMTEEEVTRVAHDVWHGVNGPNWHVNIAPQRAWADVVVTKLADHSIGSVDRET